MFQRFALASLLAAASLAATAQLRPSQPEPPSGWTNKQALVAQAPHGGRRPPARGGGGPRDAGEGRQRGRRGHRHAARARPRRAARLGTRRRRVPPRPRRDAAGARWPIDGRETAPSGADAAALPRRRRQAHALPGGGRRRALGRRARHAAPARGGARAPRQAPLGRALRAGHRDRGEGLPDVATGCTRSCPRTRRWPANAAARAYFFGADGQAKPAGTLLRNPEYAKTLRLLAAKGADAFYAGDVAADIVATVRGHANPGVDDARGPRGLPRPRRGAAVRRLPRSGSSAACRRRRPAASRCCRSWACSTRSTSRRCGPIPRRPCTCSPRRAASPSPTATATWPTTASWTCPCRGSWTGATSRNARSSSPPRSPWARRSRARPRASRSRSPTTRWTRSRAPATSPSSTRRATPSR